MSRQSAADDATTTTKDLGSKRTGRLVVGVLGLLLGAWFTWYTWGNVPFGTRERPGAGVFPLIVGIGMVVVSVLTIVEAWLTDAVTGDIGLPTGERRRTLLLVSAAVIAFVALYPFLGQYIAASLFMIVALSLLGTRSWARNILYGAAIGIGISAFFVELLEVRLPLGLLAPGGLIGGLFL